MSTLRLTTISNQGGTDSVPSQTVISGSAKAWVNFNGTGTVAIRASFNVSSITDLGTGYYRVNFTNAMTDANYSVAGVVTWSSANASGSLFATSTNDMLTGSVSVYSYQTNSLFTLIDSTTVAVVVFR
jgi:hypothetical protein